LEGPWSTFWISPSPPPSHLPNAPSTSPLPRDSLARGDTSSSPTFSFRSRFSLRFFFLSLSLFPSFRVLTETDNTRAHDVVSFEHDEWCRGTARSRRSTTAARNSSGGIPMRSLASRATPRIRKSKPRTEKWRSSAFRIPSLGVVLWFIEFVVLFSLSVLRMKTVVKLLLLLYIGLGFLDINNYVLETCSSSLNRSSRWC